MNAPPADRPRRLLALKIAALTSIPILGIMVAALLVVNLRLSRQVHETVTADLARAALSFEGRMASEGTDLIRIGAVVARDPKFFAMLTLPPSSRRGAEYHATLDGIVEDFQLAAGAAIFEITDERGVLLARGGRPEERGANRAKRALVKDAIGGRPGCGYFVESGAAYRVAVLPIYVGGSLVGTLSLGRAIDQALALALEQTTHAEVVFTIDDRVATSTFAAAPVEAALARGAWGVAGPDGGTTGRRPRRREDFTRLTFPGGERFLAYRGRVEGDEVGGHLGFVLLRSLSQETAVLARIRSDLYAAAAAVTVLALLVALAVSTGITRPVRRIVEAAVEMRRGNYDAPLDLRSGDELGILAQEFDSMRRAQQHEIERLEEIDRMKSNFIAVASHEIITPITTIGAYADLMADGSLGQVSTPQRKAIDAIHRGVEFLTRLARDLTNMSLIDRGALPVRLGVGDVGRLVAEIGDQVAPLAARRRQTLMVAAEPGLSHPRVDPDYLGQAIMNLVMNAIRFTPDGGIVEILARRVPGSVEISIRDSGIGISETDRDRIFAKMGALRNSNTHSSGTIEFNSGGLGLGLSIARGIVEAHGGAIRVESEVGRGTTFTIALPLRRSGDVDPAGEELPLAS